MKHGGDERNSVACERRVLAMWVPVVARAAMRLQELGEGQRSMNRLPAFSR